MGNRYISVRERQIRDLLKRGSELSAQTQAGLLKELKGFETKSKAALTRRTKRLATTAAAPFNPGRKLWGDFAGNHHPISEQREMLAHDLAMNQAAEEINPGNGPWHALAAEIQAAGAEEVGGQITPEEIEREIRGARESFAWYLSDGKNDAELATIKQRVTELNR